MTACPTCGCEGYDSVSPAKTIAADRDRAAMETVAIVDYQLGQKVKIAGDHDTEAVITAYTIRENGHVNYELTWIHNGTVRTGWLTKSLIEGDVKQGKIGFQK